MISRTASTFFVAALVWALVTPRATAQEVADDDPSVVEARGLFDAGRVAFAEGRFEDALDRFRAAHEASGHAELLYNIGMCLERLQRQAEAVDALSRFLDEVPDTPLRGSVQGRIDALEQAIEERREIEARAQAAAEQPAPGGSAPSDGEPGEDVLASWWLWTIVGLVVVGAAVGITLGVTLGAPGTQDPLPGDNGVVVTTLGELRW